MRTHSHTIITSGRKITMENSQRPEEPESIFLKIGYPKLEYVA